jgi:hypothetical protein
MLLHAVQAWIDLGLRKHQDRLDPASMHGTRELDRVSSPTIHAPGSDRHVANTH